MSIDNYPRCKNDPCHGKELKLHKETDDVYVLVCMSCHATYVRAKAHLSGREQWVKRLKDKQRVEEAVREIDSRPLYFT